jgi:hypothetical protein
MFEEIRRKVEGKVYRELEKKKEAVEVALEGFAREPQRAKQLVK